MKRKVCRSMVYIIMLNIAQPCSLPNVTGG
jgi:hypothetical protein